MTLALYKTLIVFCYIYLGYVIWDHMTIKIGMRTNVKGVFHDNLRKSKTAIRNRSND